MNKKFYNFDVKPENVSYLPPFDTINDKRCAVEIDGDMQSVGMIPGLCDAAVMLAEKDLLEKGSILEANTHSSHIAAGTATTDKGMEAIFVEYGSGAPGSDPDLLQAAVYDPSNGTVRACIQQAAAPGLYKPLKFDGTKRDIITKSEAVWMALLIELQERMPSVAKAFSEVQESILGMQLPTEGFKSLAVICWHMYQQLEKAEVNPLLLNLEDEDTQFKALKKDTIESGELSPQKGKRIYSTKYKVFIEGAKKKENLAIEDIDWEQYKSLPWEKSEADMTQEELDRIPEVDEFEEPSKTMVGILDEIKRTMTKQRALRSTRFILEGGSGSGKTYTVRSIAAHLRRPYATYVCGATDGPDEFLGVIVPYVMNHGKKEYQLPEEELERLRSNPNLLWPDDLEMDIEFDSENAVGKVKKLYKKLVDMILSKNKTEESSGIQYEYVATNIVWIAQHGGILEVQEPTLLQNQNALSVLYDALDKGSPGYIKTPIGEIKCSNDFVCFFTQNRKYKGTKPLNEAARSRLTHVEKMDDPSPLEVMKRLGKRCGVTDQDLLKKVTDVYFALKEKAEDLNTDGVLTLRHLQDFVDAINDDVDLKWAFERKLLWPITTEPSDCDDLKMAVEDCELFENEDLN